MSLLEYAEVQTAAKTAKQSARAFSLLSFIICLVLGYGLKYIWNIINVLQFTIFMLRWRISLPVLTDKYLRSLKMLVLFEFLPTDEVLGAAKEKASYVGSQKELFKDMALLIVGILALIVILLVLLLGKCYCLLDKS